jgi:hypothetical protein
VRWGHVVARAMRLEDKWLDPALALIFLLAVEVELLTVSYRKGSFVLNVRPGVCWIPIFAETERGKGAAGIGGVRGRAIKAR